MLYGNRHATTAEQNYAAVEDEAAAMVWALQKARLFLLRCQQMEIITDHLPLVKLFSDRGLKDIANLCLLRLKDKTLHFKFHIRYRPGGTNQAADTLSRYPVERLNPIRDDLHLEHDLHVAALTAVAQCDETLTIDQETIRQVAEEDDSYLQLRQRVQTGD